MIKRLTLAAFSIMLLTFAWGVLAQEATPEPTAPADDVPQPYLGISYGTDNDAVTVQTILPGSPADEAGLQDGDVIVAIDGESVTPDNLETVVRSYAPGDTVTITIARGGETQELDVSLGERPQMGDFLPRTPLREQRRAFLGVSVEAVENGLAIRDIVPGSAADEVGLQIDDVIVSFAGEPVGDPQGLREAVRETEPDAEVTLEIQRDGETRAVDVTLGTQRPMPRMEALLPGLASDLTYLPEEGVIEINAIDPDGPLADTDLQEGDRVVAIEGESLEPGAMRQLMPPMGSVLGDSVTLTVERGEESVEIDVAASVAIRMWMSALGGQVPMGMMPFHRDMPDRVRLGVTFTTLDEARAEEAGVSVRQGALVERVRPESPAAEAGLQAGDVITAVDGDPVDQERTLADRIRAYEAGDTVTLEIVRDGETQEVDVTLRGGMRERQRFGRQN